MGAQTGRTVIFSKFINSVCCNCIHEPLGESLSLSGTLSLSPNRRVDAGFERRSAIIGEAEKTRLKHTVTHLACTELNISRQHSARGRAVCPPKASFSPPSQWRGFNSRFLRTLIFFNDTTKEIIIGQKQRGGWSTEEKTHTLTPKTVLSNASHFPFPVVVRRPEFQQRFLFRPLVVSFLSSGQEGERKRSWCLSENFRLAEASS